MQIQSGGDGVHQRVGIAGRLGEHQREAFRDGRKHEEIAGTEDGADIGDPATSVSRGHVPASYRQALRTDGLKVEFEYAPIGGAAYRETGHPLPESTVALAEASDAVLFGAVGDFSLDTLPRHLRPEQAILGLAIGAAHNGLLPMPEIQFLAYVHNADDQIRGEAATLSFFSNGQYTNPMVVRIAGLPYQKGFGGHFHNDNSLAVFRDIPGLVIAVPSCGREAVLMLRECVRLAREDGRATLIVGGGSDILSPIAAEVPAEAAQSAHWPAQLSVRGNQVLTANGQPIWLQGVERFE